MVLKWGKAFHGQLASYQKAQMKLIEYGVLPPLSSEVDSDDEDGQEAEGITIDNPPDAAGFNYGYPDFYRDVAPHGYLPSTTHVDPRRLELNSNGLAIQDFSLQVPDAQLYDPQNNRFQDNQISPVYDDFPADSFGELVQTPLEMQLPNVGSDIGPDISMGVYGQSGLRRPQGLDLSGLQGYWTDDFGSIGGAGLYTDSTQPEAFAHCAVGASSHNHGHSQHDSGYTITSLPSSLNSSINTDYMHGVPVNPNYGASNTAFHNSFESPTNYQTHAYSGENGRAQFGPGTGW